MRFGNFEIESVNELCQNLGIEYHVVKTDIDDDCINCDNLEKSLSDSIKHIDTKLWNIMVKKKIFRLKIM